MASSRSLRALPSSLAAPSTATPAAHVAGGNGGATGGPTAMRLPYAPSMADVIIGGGGVAAAAVVVRHHRRQSHQNHHSHHHHRHPPGEAEAAVVEVAAEMVEEEVEEVVEEEVEEGFDDNFQSRGRRPRNVNERPASRAASD
ncbi:unnamed protein product [Lampetra planeri]